MSESEPLAAASVKELFVRGELLTAIREDRTVDDTRLAPYCVQLHNLGEIDLFSLTRPPNLDALPAWDFFTVQTFLVDLLPSLQGSVDEVMACVDRLVAKGGNDLAAGRPYDAFVLWCAANPMQARDVIRRARAGEERAIDYSGLALQGVQGLAEAREIASTFDGKRRLASLTAMSRLPHTEEAERQATVDTIAPMLDGPSDDALQATILEVVVSAFRSGNVVLTPDALEVVRKAVAKPGDGTRYRAAVALSMAKSALSPELADLLLDALVDVNPRHKGTVDMIDLGLRTLVKNGLSAKAIDFVSGFLTPNNAISTLTTFDSFSSALLESPTALHSTMVRWLLSAEPILCNGLASLMRRRDHEARPLNIEMDQFGLADGELWFVCRKAIGYFFTQPIVAMSFLVSTLRIAKPELRKGIEDLLFDPMLVSYSGEAHDYLKSLPATDASFPSVQEALKRSSSYIEGLRAVSMIKELHPSEYHRDVERVRVGNEMREAMQSAEEQSVFLKLVRRSTLLYGRASVTFVESPDKGRRAVEMDLHSHSVSFEFPRGEIVDSVGLNRLLLLLRAERIVK